VKWRNKYYRDQKVLIPSEIIPGQDVIATVQKEGENYVDVTDGFNHKYRVPKALVKKYVSK